MSPFRIRKMSSLPFNFLTSNPEVSLLESFLRRFFIVASEERSGSLLLLRPSEDTTKGKYLAACCEFERVFELKLSPELALGSIHFICLCSFVVSLESSFSILSMKLNTGEQFSDGNTSFFYFSEINYCFPFTLIT